ncbi:MAG: DUF6377 domain-containing protein [Rikenellaceae bacterium]
MRYIITVILFTLLPQYMLAETHSESVKSKLEALDRIIDSTNFYRDSKLSRIEQLKYKITLNQDPQQQQVLNSMLYTEYEKFDSKALFQLISDNIEISKGLADMYNYALWNIRLASFYSTSGFLKEASDIFASTRPIIKDREILLSYFRGMEYLTSHMMQYSTDNVNLSPIYYNDKTRYIDSIARVIVPDDRYYLVNKGWQHNNSDSTKYYRQRLEERYLASNRDSADDAMDAYTIAHMYNAQNNNEKFIEFLIEAAIADSKSCNHDIASFHELTNIMLDDGDIERAHTYLSYALRKAQDFGDRVRIMEIATLLDSTYAQLLAKNKAQAKKLTIFVVLLCILFSIVVLLSFNLILTNRRLRSSLANLDEANLKLDQHIVKLEEANEQLSTAYDELKVLNDSLLESNFIKENYIGHTFEVCSTHISKMEKIFMKVSNLVRNNKIDELKRYCDSSFLLNAELKILYQAFDYTFLKMYPDFIDRFNALLLPDKQIHLRTNETLNTELRIVALNRLGILDNQKVASILHCSLQTVYNNIQKTKNRTDISSKELLAEIMKI